MDGIIIDLKDLELFLLLEHKKNENVNKKDKLLRWANRIKFAIGFLETIRESKLFNHLGK